MDILLAEIESAIGIPSTQWHARCHEISLAIVRARIYPDARVARGGADGVRSQHSWIVLGPDCYDRDAPIVDPTLALWVDDIDDLPWCGTLRDGIHHPHGEGSIWNYGKPAPPTGLVIDVDLSGLSDDARRFMDIAAPDGLDDAGWSVLIHSPVEDWPSREIIGAICRHPRLRALVPIDIEGMLTDNNPSGLYLP